MRFTLFLWVLGQQALCTRSRRDKQLEHWLYHSELDTTTLALLDRSDIVGLQALYRWRVLETEKGVYDFSRIERDLELVQAKGKELWVQLQDRTFSLESLPTPDYMKTPEYDNGVAPTCDGNNCSANFTQAGWMAPQWNSHVRGRFQALMRALAHDFDGRIHGFNLPETAIEVPANTSGYSSDRYFEGELDNARYAAQVFGSSFVVQYVNFWPDESAKHVDYLPASFEFYAQHGVGVGGPDLIPFSPVQERNSYKYISEYRDKVPISVVAVQEPDLEKINPYTGRKFTKEEFVKYAINQLGVGIIFWATTSPWLNETG